jgi:succinate dehydrogenase / fumarate reductase flavoprotein subunit
MQGLADGYFVIPYTIGDYFASNKFEKLGTDHTAFKSAEKWVAEHLKNLLAIKGRQTVDTFHRRLGKILWEYSGMARNEHGLQTALEKIPVLREEFWHDVRVLGDGEEVNQSLEKAGRVADFLELGELLCRDALERRESCGAHFREEYQSPDGEAARDDENFCHVAVWEYGGFGQQPVRHIEPLEFEYVPLQTRSYK